MIEVAHLHKKYGATVAVDDVSFTVHAGEIFGILGRNGAGKTTTVECITGLRTADRGEISVLGLDPRRDRQELHERVGVQLQESAVPELMRVGEAVELYASFYREPADGRELIATLGLQDAQHTYFKHLSGGQKQRLSVVLALIGQPEIAVLDELTTGLDPEARRDTWRLIEGVRARGVTIVLVTHFMEEAERLCDRVALIDHGRVVALDRPGALAIAASTSKRVRFTPTEPFFDELLSALPEVSSVEHHGPEVVVAGSGDLVTAVVLALHRAGIRADDVQTETANLEDAFLALTDETTHADTNGADAMSTSAITLTPRQRRAFGLLVASEIKIAIRRPVGLVVAVGIPFALLVIFGSIPATTRPDAKLGGISFFNLYVPTLLVFVLIAVGLMTLPQQLSAYRRQGVLRRMSTTPVHPSWVLAAQTTVSMILAVIGLTILLGAGRRRLRPGASARRRRVPRVVRRARPHRCGDARARPARRRRGGQPADRPGADRGRVLPAGVLLRSVRPAPGDPLAGDPGHREGVADRRRLQRAPRRVRRTQPRRRAVARARGLGGRLVGHRHSPVPLGMSVLMEAPGASPRTVHPRLRPRRSGGVSAQGRLDESERLVLEPPLLPI